MHGLATRLTEYLIEYGIKSEAVREECIYGFEMLLGKALGYGTLLILGCVLHKVIPTLIFMTVFLTLRKRTGGFHMNSEAGCYIVSILVYLGAMQIAGLPVLQLLYVQLGITVCGVVTVFLLAPLNHPNLNLNQAEVQACRKLSRSNVILYAGIVILAACLQGIQKYVPYMVMGICLDAGALIVGKILGHEVKESE